MKPTTNNLDDLFDAARSEEPVISEESVRDLLGKSELMQQKPTHSFFTTKGFIMTSLIGFSAASIVAISMLASADHVPALIPVQNHPTAAVATIAPPPITPAAIAPLDLKGTDPKKTQPVKIEITTTVDETDAIDPVEPVKPVTPERSAIFAPKQVMAVKPIIAKESDLPALGISIKADSGVAFFMKANKGGYYYESVIPSSTWGLMTSGKTNIPASEVPVSVKLCPTLITDARGNRRMIIYSDDNSETKMNHSIVNTKDSNGSSIEDKMMISHFSKGPGSDTLNHGVVIITDTKHTVNTTIDGGDTIMVVNRGKEVSEQLQKVNKVINDLKLPIDKKQITDAINSAMANGLNNLDKQITIDISKDSTININSNEDGALNKNVKVNVRMLKKSANSKMKIGTIEIDGIPMLDDAQLHMAKLDDLVPVLVRSATATTLNPQDKNEYDNGVIFWFEKTPELEQALSSAPPSSVENHTPSTNKFLSSTVIYPNPTPDQAVIRFSLSEPRSLSFTLHDILGKRIADFGANEYSNSGEFTRELSLGSIPPGIYLLVIASDKGEQQIERIVVSR